MLSSKKWHQFLSHHLTQRNCLHLAIGKGDPPLIRVKISRSIDQPPKNLYKYQRVHHAELPLPKYLLIEFLTCIYSAKIINTLTLLIQNVYFLFSLGRTTKTGLAEGLLRLMNFMAKCPGFPLMPGLPLCPRVPKNYGIERIKRNVEALIEFTTRESKMRSKRRSKLNSFL